MGKINNRVYTGHCTIHWCDHLLQFERGRARGPARRAQRGLNQPTWRHGGGRLADHNVVEYPRAEEVERIAQLAALKVQCVLLLDEFFALDKMPLIVEAVAYLRRYDVRLMPIFQSPSQIRAFYVDEAAKTFFQNHPIRISYTPPDMNGATEISRELGTYTDKARSTSRPSALSKGTSSTSVSNQARALLLSQEVLDLGENEALILAKGCKLIQADKIQWHGDPALRYRRRPPPKIAPVPLVSPLGVDDASSEPSQAGHRP